MQTFLNRLSSTEINFKNMKIKEIDSRDEFLSQSSNADRVFLLLYKSGSEQSDCAYKNLLSTPDQEATIFVADVNKVRDIHPVYGITSVPSLMIFENGKFVNVIKGCHEPGFFNSVIENSLFSAMPTDESPQKRVTVYTTPSCSWCNVLKTHLRKNHIHFSEIDVSADPNAAEELVRKSGQQGVPQTDIDGEIIVGFDKNRINKMLGIN